MPDEEILEQAAAPKADQLPEIQQIPQQPPPQEEPIEEPAAEEEPKPKKNGLVALLTTLVLVCLVVEVALASYIGLTLYRNVQNQRILTAQYEAYVARQSELLSNPPKVQYIGPTIRVVDGVLVDNYAAAEYARAQAEGNIPGI